MIPSKRAFERVTRRNMLQQRSGYVELKRRIHTGTVVLVMYPSSK
jgi:hypothetical protein